MLVCKVPIRVSNRAWGKQSILPPHCPELLEPLRPQHAAQRVWSIHCTVYEDVRYMHAPCRELSIEGLT